MSRIKATDMKELQGLIAFRACETFVYNKGDNNKKKTLQKKLGVIYHGDASANIASYASLAFEGTSPFDGLFETVVTSTGTERHIPVSFTRDSSSNVVARQSFSLQMLKQATLSKKRTLPLAPSLDCRCGTELMRSLGIARRQWLLQRIK
jgi:hypothetical protein